MRGKHKKSGEAYGMGNKFTETTVTMGMSTQGFALPFSGEMMAGLWAIVEKI